MIRPVILPVDNTPAACAVDRLAVIPLGSAVVELLTGQRGKILVCWLPEVPANALTIDGEPITLDGAYLLWVA